MDEYTRENYIQYIKDGFNWLHGHDLNPYKYLDIVDGIFEKEWVENDFQDWSSRKLGVTYREYRDNFLNAMQAIRDKYKCY